MWDSYKKDLIIIATIFGLIGWSVYTCAESIMMKPAIIKLAAKSADKPVKKEAAKPAEAKKEHKKKPTLKKKYADKK